MRSATLKELAMSWEMTIEVMPSLFFAFRIISSTESVVIGSSPVVGSS